MAVVGPRDVPLKRDTVIPWTEEYAGLDPQPPLEEFLTTKVEGEGLSDMSVDMGDAGILSLVEILVMEWASYA